MLIMLCCFQLQSAHLRNPFCFSNTKARIPFSYIAHGRLNNSSKSFAILSQDRDAIDDQKNIVAKKGDVIFGYKIMDILNDILIVHDDKNNEIKVHLK